MVLSAIE